MARVQCVIVSMLVPMVVVVMCADLGNFKQLSLQESCDQRFHRGIGLAGPHCDCVLGKNGQRVLANAAGDDYLNALFAQPTWEQTGLVLGRG